MRRTICVIALLLASVLCFSCCGGEEKTESSEEASADFNEASNAFSDQSDEESSLAPESSEEISIDLDAPRMEIPEDFGYDEVDAFFNNSVFVGYSIMMHFGRYVTDWRDNLDSRIMGDAQFCAGVGTTLSNNEKQNPSTPNNTLPKYMGVAYNIEDLPAAMGVDTMYIGLTVYSDLSKGSEQTCAQEAAKCAMRTVQYIRLKSPDVKIVFLSGTYNTGENKSGSLNFNRVNNDNIRECNNLVLEYCNKNDIDFVDVSTPLINGHGLFVKQWASDGSYHIKQEPYKIWVTVLRDYAAKKQAGTWKNMDEMPSLVLN